MALTRTFWQGKRVFLTGHTGFKGSWLAAWLCLLGADVTGYSLAPETSPALFELAGLEARIQHLIGDVRDGEGLMRALTAARPELILHLAAQPLVVTGYTDPVATFATNVMGTVNLLEAARKLPGPVSLVNVTTDKCYLNHDQGRPFIESDPLGGKDPYSSSKACAELVSLAYFKSFYQAAGLGLATARAGNVIGGGDWAERRLIPDAVRASQRGLSIEVRQAQASRPWQHVLDALYGYLLLAERLSAAPEQFSQSWNFGPDPADIQPVASVLDLFCEIWGPSARWHSSSGQSFSEARLLSLNSNLARRQLGWEPQLRLRQSLEWTVDWYRNCLEGADMAQALDAQIVRYMGLIPPERPDGAAPNQASRKHTVQETEPS